MTDFLDEKRREITDRLKELKPLVDEYSRLEAAAAALDGVERLAAVRRPRLRAPRAGTPARLESAAREAAAAKRDGGETGPQSRSSRRTPRAGRRKGSGTRAAEALSFVQGQPGITIPELAAKMGIKQNYLYRVLPGLEQESKVTKKGRGWHPKVLAALARAWLRRRLTQGGVVHDDRALCLLLRPGA